MTRPDRPPLDALVIGAGFGGLAAGRALMRAGLTDIVLTDRAGGVGGTWWWNRYPGASSDVPAHFYSYSFRLKPDWSCAYPPGGEIRAYLEDCADAFGLRPRLKLGAGVEQLAFDDTSGLWRAALSTGETLTARHVVAAIGGLHEPTRPAIEGRARFTGEMFHTARWPASTPVSGRKIAIIGSAASAIQAAPELARRGAQVTVFQRTPNYIAPRGNHRYSKALQAVFRVPGVARAWRWAIYKRLDTVIYPIVRPGSKVGRFFRRRLMTRKNAALSDPALQAAMTPSYDLGCKRILISDDFYDSIESGAVRLIPSAAARLDETGVVATSGERVEAGIVLFATGYDLAGHMRSLDVTGPGGRRLSDDWADMAEAHRGAAVAGYPNFWMVAGPNTGVGTTSVVFMIEAHLDYIIPLIVSAGERGLLSPRPKAQAAYNVAIQARLQDTVWAKGGCQSWYRRPDGRIETLYPGNAADFRRMLKSASADEYERNERPVVQSGQTAVSASAPDRQAMTERTI
jgi:cation diffusion facilitator CzcD-associated flavoprotein CzcO